MPLLGARVYVPAYIIQSSSLPTVAWRRWAPPAARPRRRRTEGRRARPGETVSPRIDYTVGCDDRFGRDLMSWRRALLPGLAGLCLIALTSREETTVHAQPAARPRLSVKLAGDF